MKSLKKGWKRNWGGRGRGGREQERGGVWNEWHEFAQVHCTRVHTGTLYQAAHRYTVAVHLVQAAHRYMGGTHWVTGRELPAAPP